MKLKIFSLLIATVFIAACGNAPKKVAEEPKSPKYKASWESLAQHNEEPDWFQDAKLGIYFHWGVYSVPAFGNEWYPSRMHYEKNKEYKHHLEKYGHPSKFGYHDFVPLFKAEKFNADEWADLFVKAGARFAGPVAEHHDGFSMWDSEITPWNAADEGPQKDITGLLQKSITERGMKFITTFHHARNLQETDTIVKVGKEIVRQLGHYPSFEDMPTVSEDKKLKYLYGNLPAEQWYKEVWFGKLKEVIDLYQPDIIWFDSWLDRVPENLRQEFCAYYLNEAEKLGKEVVIVRKQNDLPLDCSVDDLEKSRKNELEKKSWMTDETVSTGSWCFTENLQVKPAADVLHVLIDIVSKNGVLLLNISPKADGTIPADQQNVLLKMGEWLGEYGESIYGSRPWYTFGEGPTKEPEGHFSNHAAFLKIKYSAKDVRYTTNKGNIYATILGWPGDNKEVLFEAFSKDEWKDAKSIKNVTLLGSKEKIQFELTDAGLKVTTPAKATNDMAVVFKIEM